MTLLTNTEREYLTIWMIINTYSDALKEIAKGMNDAHGINSDLAEKALEKGSILMSTLSPTAE